MNVAQIALILQLVVAVFAGYMIALWFTIVIWTYYDIRSRSQDVYVHICATLFVVVFHVFGLVLYFFLRPRQTLAEAYEQSLAEEALLQELEERQLCPSCHQRVQPDYQLCPHCHQQLKHQCPHCSRLLHLKWDLCPYCGQSPEKHRPLPEPRTVPSRAERRPVRADSVR